jgi:hypothetical protein
VGSPQGERRRANGCGDPRGRRQAVDVRLTDQNASEEQSGS